MIDYTISEPFPVGLFTPVHNMGHLSRSRDRCKEGGWVDREDMQARYGPRHTNV